VAAPSLERASAKLGTVNEDIARAHAQAHAEEVLRQNNLIYGGLIAIGAVMVQPFLLAAALDLPARICVVAFAVAIPLLAALALLNRQEGFRPRALAIAPDGARAYALAVPGHRLMELDLLGSAERRLADVPGAAQALAVAGPHLYVPDPYGGAVLVLDRRSGAPVARARVGRRPAGVLAVGPA
jgi:hypothetical protein